MIKRVLGILALTALLVSCGNKDQKSETSDKEIAKVTVDEVVANMQNFVDQEIVIVGTVNHVCSHGGKRMFIMGEDPDVAIKITPGEEIGVFEKELEGSHVIVTGIVKELRIDEAYVANLEKEISEGADNEAIHEHSGGKHEEDEENAKAEVDSSKIKQIEHMKTQIAESEEGYYSQFWIEARKFEVKEGAHNHEHAEDEAHDNEHTEDEAHDNEHTESE